jgi:hypothetical protein
MAWMKAETSNLEDCWPYCIGRCSVEIFSYWFSAV